MLKKLIKTYYKLLDEKLENGTIVVLLIAILVVSTSLITNKTNANLLVKTNVIESHLNQYSIIDINGVKYKIILEEINKKYK